MTEPKVVHKWWDGETEYSVLTDGALQWEQVDIGSRSICEGTLSASSITRELARLAARVEEAERMLAVRVDDEKGLVAENKRLREALESIAILGSYGDDRIIAPARARRALKEKP